MRLLATVLAIAAGIIVLLGYIYPLPPRIGMATRVAMCALFYFLYQPRLRLIKA